MSIIYKVPQATVMVFERLGRYNRVAAAGLRFRLPGIDAPKELPDWGMAVRECDGKSLLIELAEQQSNTQPRTIITRDNVEMLADASVYWQIIDPVRAVYEVDNLPRTVADLAVTTLRNLLGAMTLNEAVGARARINEGLLSEIEATGRKWGVRVNRVELQELRAANEEASGAMLQQMAAERDRDARVARAEGERQARSLRAEGTARALRTLVESDLDVFTQAQALMGPQAAFQYLLALKYLDTLEKIADSPSVKVFLPAGANPDPLVSAGIAGLGPGLPSAPPPAGADALAQPAVVGPADPSGE